MRVLSIKFCLNSANRVLQSIVGNTSTYTYYPCILKEQKKTFQRRIWSIIISKLTQALCSVMTSATSNCPLSTYTLRLCPGKEKKTGNEQETAGSIGPYLSGMDVPLAEEGEQPPWVWQPMVRLPWWAWLWWRRRP